MPGPLAERVRILVDGAPRLTPEQLDRLSMLLRPPAPELDPDATEDLGGRSPNAAA